MNDNMLMSQMIDKNRRSGCGCFECILNPFFDVDDDDDDVIKVEPYSCDYE